MGHPDGSNSEHANDLLESAKHEGTDLRVVELDVQSQSSADDAVQSIIDASGRIDVVVNNAGHLYVGYTEAFTAEDVNNLFDINATGAQRVNRAALPHMREQRDGLLLYVGSTIPISTPPFLGPYVASKAAMDALAVVTSYEVGQFGVETVIVMPGAFTKGSQHFPNASHAGDEQVTAAYAELDPLVARNEDATNSLFDPDDDGDPVVVAQEIVRLLALPKGEKPFRSVVDLTHAGVERANAVNQQVRADFVTRMGFSELLTVRTGG